MISRKNVHRKLYEYVVDELGLQIIRGDYRPGETLPNEEALCKEFDVSRGVLREAMKVLIQKGLLESKTKTGTFVRLSNSWNLFDPDVLIWKYETGAKPEFLKNIMEVRRIIEPEAARLAAERASVLEVKRIQAIYDDMRCTISDKGGYSSEEFIRVDLEFHTAILEACHNELLAQIGRTMRRALLTARQSDRHDLAAQKHTLLTHIAILEAIAAHKPEEAYHANQALITQVWRDMQQQWEQEEKPS
ncbi:GntR family transcriptional regulator [candidate division KSB3 bacterium]|uniref:GntR family transcriptional regulator n=1 Tax=candidate division KSB3 bacterium TaxID=2044937 RepID=A0A2G6KF79_9BACT|nr:MAG: GntR family transcriptional regulator [candidate division KSB3 bacterium]